MTSSPQHGGAPESAQEESILLEGATLRLTLKQLFDSVSFALVTIVAVADLSTDVWVLVLMGERGERAFLGTMTALFLLGSLVVAAGHQAARRRRGADGERALPNAYVNFCLNVPLQLGVLVERCAHGLAKCRRCCPKRVAGHAHVQGPRGKPTNADWRLAELKLQQSVFHCAPQLVGNLLNMLARGGVGVGGVVGGEPGGCCPAPQIASAAFSFLSIVLGVVLHEKARKEQGRGALLGLPKLLCIAVYKTLVIGTRLLAIVHFIYYFGGWLAALVLPHVLVMFSFYVYLYRQVWKVRYQTIVEHSLYSVLAYFPIHSEYRPEGEIVLFYILFMVENIVMVALPFKLTPTMTIGRQFQPTSRYYFVVMLTILVGSTTGLVFMCAYYFLFHKSRHSIRDTHLGWLASLCEWRKQEVGEITVNVSNGQSRRSVSASSGSAAAVMAAASGAGTGAGNVDVDGGVPGVVVVGVGVGGGGAVADGDEISRDLDVDVVSSDRRGFHTHDDGSRRSCRHLADVDVDTSLLNANVVKFVSSAPNPEAGSQSERLLIQGDIHQDQDNRPSVLEGEDDDDDDQRHIIV